MGICLFILVILPLIGGALIGLAKPGAARPIALAVSFAAAALAIAIACGFDFHPAITDAPLPGQGIQARFPSANDSLATGYLVSDLQFGFNLGLDSISFWMLMLSAFVSPLALLAGSAMVTQRSKEFYAWMLVLIGSVNGVFAARDLLLFYIFFELTLVPSFFLIGLAGGRERRDAAIKFFIYTFAGSALMLVGILYLGLSAHSFDLDSLITSVATLPEHTRWLVLLSLLAGFMVKVPLFPFHTWQAGAYAESPAPSSALLAGVLAKLGTYGFIRLVIPLGFATPSGAPLFLRTIQVLAVLCLIGILYAALIAWVQRDMKKLLAFSSFSHLGFCILGLLAFNTIGLSGSVLYMVNHGISTVALFLCVGMIISRVRSRDLEQISGLAKVMPKLAFFFVLFMFSSIGLPGLNGFVSEFLTILGAFTSGYLGIGFGVIAALGVILGALYMLHMTSKIIFGPLKLPTAMDLGEPGVTPQMMDAPPIVRDIGGLEVALLVPLALAVIVLGVASPMITKTVEPAVNAIQNPPRMMTAHAAVQNEMTLNLTEKSSGSKSVAE